MSENNVALMLGIDLGSRNVKLCLMGTDGIVRKETFETVSFYRRHGMRTEGGFSIDYASLDVPADTPMVATGYGRMAAAISGATTVSELTAHALGAVFQTGLDTFTLVDIGGQDYKVMQIVGGRVTDMAANDKCAASTGRYLENMARILEITIESLGGYRERPSALSATCAIFGESELIGLMVRGEPVESLAAGVNRAVVERILPLLDRMGEGLVVVSGGVARNAAVLSFIGELTGREVITAGDPVHNGAIGCCIYGKKSICTEKK